MKRTGFAAVAVFTLCATPVFSQGFLIDLVFGMLPPQVRSAFKGEGLESDQLHYGFGNCAFTALGYLSSELEYSLGDAIHQRYTFVNPTLYSYAGSIAHVSTPLVVGIRPGWQLELELGYGGTSYDPSTLERAQKFYFAGMTGFNWRMFQTPRETRFGVAVNMGIGYKLSAVLKDEIYWLAQAACAIIPQRLVLGAEYFDTLNGGSLLIYANETLKSRSKETAVSTGVTWVINERYALKLAGVIRDMRILTPKSPDEITRMRFTGVVLSLLTL
jgi:hypothetical protein